MIITSVALLVAVPYSAMSIYFARKFYRIAKLKNFETDKGRKKWQETHGAVAFWCVILGSLWPVDLVVIATAKTVKGIGWLVTHNQEIPAETQEKIKELEKEVWGEEPEDARPQKTDERTLCAVCGDKGIYITDPKHLGGCPYATYGMHASICNCFSCTNERIFAQSRTLAKNKYSLTILAAPAEIKRKAELHQFAGWQVDDAAMEMLHKRIR